jgi:hypothetical protein
VKKQWNDVGRLARPMTWSVRTRRLFVLLLPIAVPVWVAAFAAMVVGAIAGDICAAVRRFWSAPPRKRTRHNSYGYERRRRPGDRRSARVAVPPPVLSGGASGALHREIAG